MCIFCFFGQLGLCTFMNTNIRATPSDTFLEVHISVYVYMYVCTSKCIVYVCHVRFGGWACLVTFMNTNTLYTLMSSHIHAYKHTTHTHQITAYISLHSLKQKNKQCTFRDRYFNIKGIH